MKRDPKGMHGTMTRLAVKSGLAALSLAATLAGWGFLAYRDVQGDVQPAQAVVESPDLPPIPEVAGPPPEANGMASLVQESLAGGQPSLPAKVVRPVARTRSSR